MRKIIYILCTASAFIGCSEEKPQDSYISTGSHELTVSKDNFELDYKGETLKIEIKSNGKWKAVSNVDWISVDNNEREGHGVLYITVAQNTSKYYSRSGQVDISYDVVKRPISIHQEQQGLLKVVIDGKHKFNMVPIEKGTFTMGDNSSSDNVDHQVEITKDYYIGETEVTQLIWLVVTGYMPTESGKQWEDLYRIDINNPAYYISYNDCKKFIEALNSKTGFNFRFPTEAEWEFAAKGGNKSKGYRYAGGNNLGDVAWHKDNAAGLGLNDPAYGTHEVKTKRPNELGLYDMSGNVREWCLDWYEPYSVEAQRDPSGPSSRPSYGGRVYRGGTWGSDASDCLLNKRDSHSEGTRSQFVGLRLAL